MSAVAHCNRVSQIKTICLDPETKKTAVPFGSAVLLKYESRHGDSNPGPTLYESVALPAELWRRKRPDRFSPGRGHGKG